MQGGGGDALTPRAWAKQANAGKPATWSSSKLCERRARHHNCASARSVAGLVSDQLRKHKPYLWRTWAKQANAVSLGNGVRLRNCPKDARDTAIFGLCRNTESRHDASRMRAPHGSHETRHAHGSCNEGITRMMVVSVGSNRNLHLVSALPDERSEPDERRFGGRDSNSRSSRRRREVANYLAGELSREVQTPHQKKTLQQETSTDPMRIWWESYQLLDAQLSLHQSRTCGSSSGIWFFIPTTTTVGNPQFLIGNIRRQLLLLQLLHLKRHHTRLSPRSAVGPKKVCVCDGHLDVWRGKDGSEIYGCIWKAEKPEPQNEREKDSQRERERHTHTHPNADLACQFEGMMAAAATAAGG